MQAVLPACWTLIAGNKDKTSKNTPAMYVPVTQKPSLYGKKAP
jgi:hypothetical protein